MLILILEPHLSGPALPRDYLSDTLHIPLYGEFLVSQCGRRVLQYRFPWHSHLRCYITHTRGYLSDTCTIPHVNKEIGCDPPPPRDIISKVLCDAGSRWHHLSFWRFLLWFIAKFSNLRQTLAVRPIVVFLGFPCFTGISAFFGGLPNPNWPFVRFDPLHGPIYTPKALRSSGKMLRFWRAKCNKIGERHMLQFQRMYRRVSRTGPLTKARLPKHYSTLLGYSSLLRALILQCCVKECVAESEQRRASEPGLACGDCFECTLVIKMITSIFEVLKFGRRE